MIWDSGEQLSRRPSGKNEIEHNVEVGSTGGKKEEWDEVVGEKEEFHISCDDGFHDPADDLK